MPKGIDDCTTMITRFRCREIVLQRAATILLRVSYRKELALSVQPLLLRVSYRIISVVPIIAEGKIIAARHRRLYDYYAFHAVNSAAATIIANRQELRLYYYVFYRKELALQ